MRSSWIILISLACASCDLFQDIKPIFESYFVKFHGGSGDQIGEDLIRLDDGGYMIVGTTFPLGEDVPIAANIIIIRTDSLGNQVWQKEFGDSLQNEGVAIVQGQTADEFVIAGNEISGNGNSKVIWFAIDQDGVLISPINKFGIASINSNSCSDLIAVSQGYFITGTTTDVSLKGSSAGGLDIEDALTLKLELNLTRIDSTIIEYGHGFEGRERGQTVIEIEENSGYLVLGYGDPRQSDLLGQNFWAISFSYDGLPRNSQQGGTNVVDEINDAVRSFDDVFALGTSQDGVSRELHIAELDLDGNFSSDVILNDPSLSLISLTGESISILRTDEIVILATQTDQNQEVYLIKTATSGEVLWSKKFGAPGQENKGGSVLQNPDGSIVFVGTNHFQSDTKKIMLVKTNRKGEVDFE